MTILPSFNPITGQEDTELVPPVKPFTYEELVAWRTICEYLDSCERKRLMYEPGDKIPELKNLPSWKYFWKLLGFNRDRRSALYGFQNSQISLVRWDRKYRKCWQLRADWHQKIEWLEKVILLRDDPNTIPKPWIEAAERKNREKRVKMSYSNLAMRLSQLDETLGDLEFVKNGKDFRLKNYLNWIKENASESRYWLKQIEEENVFLVSQCTDAVLSPTSKIPPDAAVLSDRHYFAYLLSIEPEKAIKHSFIKEVFLKIRQRFLKEIMGLPLPIVVYDQKFILSADFCNLNYLNIRLYNKWMATIRRGGRCICNELLTENLQEFLKIYQAQF